MVHMCVLVDKKKAHHIAAIVAMIISPKNQLLATLHLTSLGVLHMLR
jgi:hypothetical protein